MNKLNKEEFKDKVYACWIGKNIGGTMGGPYEGKKEILDVRDFITPSGAPLPNDDLDLQLVWLLAMEEHGPHKLNEHILAEYWINYIPPHWNEYGVCKSNLKAGILPPMSGEYKNNRWKHSNGAWIRSEVWACMAPGCPDVALRYAFADACVDHGMGEGMYAELFTAALQSAAFTVNDIRSLIDIGLSKIPGDCKIAKSVKTVLECYDNSADWKTTRNILVEQSADLGWFQAPANLGFVIIGLLYGEGDFKKSMLYAINCGDDTDCTAATIGSTLGIMYGSQGIPEDWRDHIGDSIITVSVDRSCFKLAETCSELSQRVLRQAPFVLMANKANMEITECETQIEEGYAESAKGTKVAVMLCDRSGYSYDYDFIYARARVEFKAEPTISPLETINASIRFFCTPLPDDRHLNFKVFLPENWKASYKRDMVMDRSNYDNGDRWIISITAGEIVNAINRVWVEVSSPGRPGIGLIPILIMG